MTKSSVSFTPAVSNAECIASWGRPISTVSSGTLVLEMLPRVEPPAMSLRLAKVCHFRPRLFTIDLNRAADTASVVYFWLALYFITTPPFITGRLVGSASEARLGCTAWALSALIIKLWDSARRKAWL